MVVMSGWRCRLARGCIVVVKLLVKAFVDCSDANLKDLDDGEEGVGVCECGRVRLPDLKRCSESMMNAPC